MMNYLELTKNAIVAIETHKCPDIEEWEEVTDSILSEMFSWRIDDDTVKAISLTEENQLQIYTYDGRSDDYYSICIPSQIVTAGDPVQAAKDWYFVFRYDRIVAQIDSDNIHLKEIQDKILTNEKLITEQTEHYLSLTKLASFADPYKLRILNFKE